MTKTFRYFVNGMVIEDSVAFGDAWKKAVAIAKEKHLPIYRQVIRGEEVSNQFCAIGGAFINEKYFKKESLRIF